MEAPLKILLFGDQTEDSIALLQNLGQSKDNIFLKAFLDKAYFVLREEVSQQPSSVKDCIPKFNSIPDLLARYSEPIASKYNGLESALTCISQLANFIRFVPRPHREAVLTMLQLPEHSGRSISIGITHPSCGFLHRLACSCRCCVI